ncbi:MAG: glucose 1-dehydrogenase [Dehalococcoidales bacterium]|nr:glucose 1-dehydrogenase [Dehalococcoidales bacterium]
MRRLENKVAIVTGAARGNGEGTARVMAKEGADVVLTDVLDLVHETAKNITDEGDKAVSFKMDITNASEVNSVVQKVLAQFGKIDILVNNAGVCQLVPFVDMSEEILDKTLDINVKGVFIVTKAVLPSMLKQKYGRIINFSSVTGPLVADVGECAYAATKAAVWGFTRSLALEVAKEGITVNAICPGMIATEMVKNNASLTNPEDPESVLRDLAKGIPMGRLGNIYEIGELVAFLASDAAKYITGTPVLIDGGSTIPESPGSFTTI